MRLTTDNRKPFFHGQKYFLIPAFYWSQDLRQIYRSFWPFVSCFQCDNLQKNVLVCFLCSAVFKRKAVFAFKLQRLQNVCCLTFMTFWLDIKSCSEKMCEQIKMHNLGKLSFSLSVSESIVVTPSRTGYFHHWKLSLTRYTLRTRYWLSV